MRLIFTTQDPETASRLSLFLRREGISNELEIGSNVDWGSSDYGTLQHRVWVIDEDQLKTAQQWVEEFEKNPGNPVFKEGEKPLLVDFEKDPLQSRTRKRERRPKEKGLGFMTLYILSLCTFLFLYGELTSPPLIPPLPKDLPLTALYSPPINKVLFFDYPKAYEIVDKLESEFGIEKLRDLNELPEEGKVLVEQYRKTPYWKGFYEQIVSYFNESSASFSINAPLFEKIRQGDIWRSVTPAFLHQNIFHLFFNMLWIIVLGKIMEERLGTIQFGLFVLITALISNVAQYLMSGANFIGISGVICAMLGFIYARQRNAPWEGYHLNPGVLSFMFFFILAMVGLQTLSFFLEVFFKETFVPGIANTAHVTGALSGFLLGQGNAFSARKTG